MPKGTHHQSLTTTKLLNIGDPGGGKTGALACLAEAGYRLIIVDFDNGLDILIGRNGLLRKNKKALENIFYETFTDPLQAVADGQMLPVGTPTAFNRAMKGLTRWKFSDGEDSTYDLGNIGSWGPDTICVIDSFGHGAEAALRFCRQLNAHQLDRFIHQSDYGQAMQMLEGMLQLLYATNIKCHVIVNSHITYMEDASKGTLRGLPRALGRVLPPKVGGYFNTIIRTVTEGSGKSERHIIRTASESNLELKLPVAPGVIPDTLPIKSGLLTIFKTLQGVEGLSSE